MKDTDESLKKFVKEKFSKNTENNISYYTTIMYLITLGIIAYPFILVTILLAFILIIINTIIWSVVALPTVIVMRFINRGK
jgi:hypothetical protein